MNSSTPLAAWARNAKAAAGIGLVGSVILGLRYPGQFFQSYLFAYMVFLGVALGCLGLLLLHSLVGGKWGHAIRPILQTGADLLPWMALLFLPILLGVRHIYPWTEGFKRIPYAVVAEHKKEYFNLSFFAARAVLYFSFWSWIAKRQRTTTAGSAVGLLLYVLTVSFASIDWVMSLEMQWASSIDGALLMVGDVLSGLAFSVMVLNVQSRSAGEPMPVIEDTAHDLGNLLLAFVMLWVYMSLSQYLIIWYGNLPEEVGWYIARQRGGWQYVAIAIILFEFALPFLLLLGRERKRRLERLAKVAALIVFMRIVDIFWLTVPDFSPGHLSFHLLDLTSVLFLGGACLFLFCRSFEPGPLS